MQPTTSPHNQLRENPGIDFELVRHNALQRVLNLSQYHSRVWQEKATRLTLKAGRESVGMQAAAYLTKWHKRHTM